MTIGDEADEAPDDEPFSVHPSRHRSAADAQRMWRHPSEVAAETRGSVDRRRSTLIASGVLLGGIGLLVTSLLMGSARAAEDAEAVEPALPSAVATVTFTEIGSRSRALPGVPLDDEGHLLIACGDLPVTASPSGSEDDTGHAVWVEGFDGREHPAQVLGVDDDLGIAVLATPRAGDVAAFPAVLEAGDELAVLAAGDQAPVLHGRVRVVSTGSRSSVELLHLAGVANAAPLVEAVTGEVAPGDVLVDGRGDFAGVVGGDPTGRVVPADEVLDAAHRLIAAAG